MKKPVTITPEAGHRLFRDIQGDILPSVGELINQLILEGKTEEEIMAAMRTAAMAYREMALFFISPA